MTDDGRVAGKQTKRREDGSSVAAELAAYVICKVALDLSERKGVSGFAIDSAQPHEPIDRDDAVKVEYRQDVVLGRLTILHVTIADVASVIPRAAEREVDRKLGALDEAARTKGQTKYFSHGSRPMFPRRLQDRMSLEHNKERAGLTVSITYDGHCNRIHTELSRTRIFTACKTYKEASEHIVERGAGNAMQQISLLAKNLMKRAPGVTRLPHYDEKTGMYIDTEGQARHISSEVSSSYIAVQGCMIAANEAVAELMCKSNFMFRNHCAREQGGSKVMLESAQYGEECKGHYGLASAMYSHVTSPIRRYADVVNQRMQHWAIDVVEAVVRAAEAEMRTQTCSREKLMAMVWDQALELLGRATAFKEAGRNRSKIAAGRLLEDVIADILLPVMGAEASQDAAAGALRALDAMELAYTRKEISTVARLLNEKAARNRPEGTPDELMNATLDAIFLAQGENGEVLNPEYKEEAIRRRRPFKFAELLEAAARRGDNNDFFAREVSRRLRSEEDKAELVRNLYTLLVIAEKKKDSRWQDLKREAFQLLKDDNELCERVFNHLRAQDNPPKVVIVETSLLNKGMASPEALVVLTHEGVDYAAPMKDIGDTAEAARAGALLTFFRHYGNIHPYNEMRTPRLIDLALGRARVKRGGRLGLLKRVCGEEFSLEAFSQYMVHDSSRIEVTLRVMRRSDGEMLEKTRCGWQDLRDEYLDKCAKEVIEDYRFVDMLSQLDTPVMGEKPVMGAQLPFAKRDAVGG